MTDAAGVAGAGAAPMRAAGGLAPAQRRCLSHFRCEQAYIDRMRTAVDYGIWSIA